MTKRIILAFNLPPYLSAFYILVHDSFDYAKRFNLTYLSLATFLSICIRCFWMYIFTKIKKGHIFMFLLAPVSISGKSPHLIITYRQWPDLKYFLPV